MTAISIHPRPVRAFMVAAAMMLALLLGLLPAAALTAANAVTIKTRTGTHVIEVEWAVTPAEREKGLMYRKNMPDDHGMLFDFGGEQSVAFWMHNTPLSLDMVFIAADGTVRRIEKRAKPYSDDNIPSGAPVRYVLEINGGKADRIGLAPGDRIGIPAR